MGVMFTPRVPTTKKELEKLMKQQAQIPVLPNQATIINVHANAVTQSESGGESGGGGGGGESTIAWLPTVSESGDVSFTRSSTTTPPKVVNIKGQSGAEGKSTYELAVEDGFTGTVSEWLESIKGEPGESITGDAGKSAYEIWLDDGNTGTAQDFLASLVGNTGADGKSAYDIAVEHGFTGTEADWLESLKVKGADGKSAYDIAVERGFVGSEEEWLESLKGADGRDALVSVLLEIPVSLWAPSTAYPGYTYQADVPIDGLLSSDLAMVDFDVQSTIIATSALVLSSGETFDGFVRLYAKNTPANTLTGCCSIVKDVG